jgi:hypothetical protein
MDAATRQFVRHRANSRCEYCGLREEDSPLAALHVEHVLPKKHGGTDDPDNLALACVDCNLCKGSNVAGYDPEAGQLTELFSPRRHRWEEHFTWRGPLIVGLTPIGKTTVEVLRLNSEERVQLRLVSFRRK